MKLAAFLSFLLLFAPSISQSSENSLYGISTQLIDQVKKLDQIEQAINNMIQSHQYKTDDLFFMSTDYRGKFYPALVSKTLLNLPPDKNFRIRKLFLASHEIYFQD